MPADSPVSVERTDGLAVVTVDAPPLNLFDGPMGTGLVAAIDELERSAPRAVLFRFEGKMVTGGVDVRVFEPLDAAGAAGLFTALVTISQRVAALPCPTVFAAHGTTLTWGFELALACDLILATDKAKFGLVEATVGLSPAMGGTQRLAERAGTGRAREFVMTGDLYDAATMHSWGVVNRVLPVDGFDGEARALAHRLSAGPTLAHAVTKNVLRSYLDGGVAKADADVPALAGELFATEDLRNAVQTFLTIGPGHSVFEGR